MAVKAVGTGYNVKVSAELGKGYSWEDESLRWSIQATDDQNMAKIETDPVFTIALARLTAELARKRAVEVNDVIVEEAVPEPKAEATDGETVF